MNLWKRLFSKKTPPVVQRVIAENTSAMERASKAADNLHSVVAELLSRNDAVRRRTPHPRTDR